MTKDAKRPNCKQAFCKSIDLLADTTVLSSSMYQAAKIAASAITEASDRHRKTEFECKSTARRLASLTLRTWKTKVRVSPSLDCPILQDFFGEPSNLRSSPSW